MDLRGRMLVLWVSALVLLLVACGGAAATPTQTVAPTATVTSAARASVAAASPVTSTATVAATSTGTRVASPAAPAGGASPAASPTRAASPAASPASPVASPRAAASPRVSSYPLTVKDDAGRSVTLKARPRKIVSLAPSNTEVLYALGLGDRVVGVDTFSDYPEAAKAKPKIGGFATANLEEVVALGPDLVLAAGIQSKDYIAGLEARGLTVVVLAPKDLPGVLDSISLVGQLADVNADAATLRGGLDARLAATAERFKGATARPRVYWELDPALYTAGPNSFIDDLIKRAGGVNIAADSATPFPQLSAEAVIAKDPEVIVLTDEVVGATIDSVKARPGWAGISAVKNNRIVSLDPNLASRPGPRIFDTLERLLLLFQPQLFR